MQSSSGRFLLISAVLCAGLSASVAQAGPFFAAKCGDEGTGSFTLNMYDGNGYCASAAAEGAMDKSWDDCLAKVGVKSGMILPAGKRDLISATATQCFEDGYKELYATAAASYFGAMLYIPKELRTEIQKCETDYNKQYFNRYLCEAKEAVRLSGELRASIVAGNLDKVSPDLRNFLIQKCGKKFSSDCVGGYTDQLASASTSMADMWEALVVSAKMEAACETGGPTAPAIYFLVTGKACNKMIDSAVAVSVDEGNYFQSPDNIDYIPPKKKKPKQKPGGKIRAGAVAGGLKDAKAPKPVPKKVAGGSPPPPPPSPTAGGGSGASGGKGDSDNVDSYTSPSFGPGEHKECPKGVDCNLLSKVEITDPHGFVDGRNIYQCPAFLKEYNCLGIGSGDRGDLLKASSSPELANQWCMNQAYKELDMPPLLANLPGFTRSPLILTVSPNVRVNDALNLVKFINGKYPDSKMPACEYFFKDMKKAPKVPLLDSEEMLEKAAHSQSDISGVAGDDLHDLMMFAADAVTTDVGKDLGVFSVQKQAMQIFLTSAYINPGVMENQALLDQLTGSLTDKSISMTSCLNNDKHKDDAKKLKGNLNDVVAAWRKTAADDPEGMKGFQNRWFDKHVAAAKVDKQLEKASNTLNYVWGDLGCDRRASQIPDPTITTRDSHGTSFANSPNVFLDEYWPKKDSGGTLGHDDSRYKGRVAFFQETLKNILGYDLSMGGDRLSCKGIEKAKMLLDEKRAANISNNPLLAQVAKDTEYAFKVECDDGMPIDVSPMACGCSGHWVSTYGPAEPAIIDTVRRKRGNGSVPIDCYRPRTLSDRLIAGEGLDALKKAAETMRGRAVENLIKICGPGKTDKELAEEGKRASCMDGLVSDFLGCTDSGSSSKECHDRQSFGWTFCRSCTQKVMDKQWEEVKNFYKQMGLMVLNTALIFVPGGGLVASLALRGINLALIGYSAYEQHEMKVESEAAEAQAYVDFQNQNISWDEYKGALAKAEAAGDHYVMWQLVNVAFAGIELSAVKGILTEAKNAAAFRKIGTIISEGSDAKAVEEGLRDSKGVPRSTEETYHMIRVSPQGGEKLASQYLDLVVRPGLIERYGQVVNKLKDPNDVLALASLEEDLTRIERGGAEMKAKVREIRAKVAEGLKDPEKFATQCKGGMSEGCMKAFFEGVGETVGLKRTRIPGEIADMKVETKIASEEERLAADKEFRKIKGRKVPMSRADEQSKALTDAAAVQLEANGVKFKKMCVGSPEVCAGKVPGATGEWYIVILPGTETPMNRYALAMAKKHSGAVIAYRPKDLWATGGRGMFSPEENMLELSHDSLMLTSVKVKKGASPKAGDIFVPDENAVLEIRPGYDHTVRHETKHSKFHDDLVKGDIQPYHGIANAEDGVLPGFQPPEYGEFYHRQMSFDEMATYQQDLGGFSKDLKKGIEQGKGETELSTIANNIRGKIKAGRMVSQRAYEMMDEALGQLATAEISYFKEGNNIIAGVTVKGKTGTYTMFIPVPGAKVAEDTAKNLEALQRQLSTTREVASAKVAIFNEADRIMGKMNAAIDPDIRQAYATTLDSLVNGKKGTAVGDLRTFTDDSVNAFLKPKGKMIEPDAADVGPNPPGSPPPVPKNDLPVGGGTPDGKFKSPSMPDKPDYVTVSDSTYVQAEKRLADKKDEIKNADEKQLADQIYYSNEAGNTRVAASESDALAAKFEKEHGYKKIKTVKHKNGDSATIDIYQLPVKKTQVNVMRVQMDDGHWWFMGNFQDLPKTADQYKVYVHIPSEAIGAEAPGLALMAKEGNALGFKFGASPVDLARDDRFIAYFSNPDEAYAYSQKVEKYLEGEGYKGGHPDMTAETGEHTSIGVDRYDPATESRISQRKTASRAMAKGMKACAEKALTGAACRKEICGAFAAAKLFVDFVPAELGEKLGRKLDCSEVGGLPTVVKKGPPPIPPAAPKKGPPPIPAAALKKGPPKIGADTSLAVVVGSRASPLGLSVSSDLEKADSYLTTSDRAALKTQAEGIDQVADPAVRRAAVKQLEEDVLSTARARGMPGPKPVKVGEVQYNLENVPASDRLKVLKRIEELEKAGVPPENIQKLLDCK